MEDRDRYLENLRTVAVHLSRGRPGTPPPTAPRGGGSPAGRRWARWGSAGAGLMFLLGKLKFLQLGSLLSMGVAVWAYTMLWGFPFAVGFVALIFVHEAGHAVALRRQGLRAGAPVFIPFVGAVIAMKDLPRNAYVEAVVGVGGPALGTLGAAACLLVAWLTGSPFWYALASTGFLLNLFNMIPISPLDGGRIVGVISRWLWLAGYVLGIIILIVTRSPILFVILLLGLFSLGKTLRGHAPDYYAIAPGRRARMGVAYFGLIGVMAVGMAVAQGPLRHLQP